MKKLFFLLVVINLLVFLALRHLMPPGSVHRPVTDVGKVRLLGPPEVAALVRPPAEAEAQREPESPAETPSQKPDQDMPAEATDSDDAATASPGTGGATLGEAQDEATEVVSESPVDVTSEAVFEAPAEATREAVSEAPADAAPEAVSEPPEAATPDAKCISLGPFNTRAGAARVSTDFSGRGMANLVRDGVERIIESYWVLVPANSDRNARSIVARLRQADESDIWHIQTGERQGYVSVGIYQQEKYAQQRAARMSALGLETETVPRYREKRPAFWVDLGQVASHRFQETMSASLAENYPGRRLERHHCAEAPPRETGE